VVPHFYMSGSRLKHGGFGNTNGTRAITHERYMGTLLTKVTERVCDPKQLWAKLAAATYSAFVVDWTTLDCLQENQKTSEEPRNWQVPKVDFWSTRHPAKSASEKTRSESEEDAEYQRPCLGVYRRYLKIRLMACRCEVRDDAWKRAHRHMEN
jgi:hypothetical protein